MSALQYVKLVMLAFASLFALYVGGRDLRTALTETEPTLIPIAAFSERYDGERFVEISGRLAIEHAVSVPDARSASVDVHVPVVPRDLAVLKIRASPERQSHAPWRRLRSSKMRCIDFVTQTHPSTQL